MIQTEPIDFNSYPTVVGNGIWERHSFGNKIEVLISASDLDVLYEKLNRYYQNYHPLGYGTKIVPFKQIMGDGEHEHEYAYDGEKKVFVMKLTRYKSCD